MTRWAAGNCRACLRMVIWNRCRLSSRCEDEVELLLLLMWSSLFMIPAKEIRCNRWRFVRDAVCWSFDRHTICRCFIRDTIFRSFVNDIICRRVCQRCNLRVFCQRYNFLNPCHTHRWNYNYTGLKKRRRKKASKKYKKLITVSVSKIDILCHPLFLLFTYFLLQTMPVTAIKHR